MLSFVSPSLDSGMGRPPSESFADAGSWMGPDLWASIPTQSRMLDAGFGLTLGDVQVLTSSLLVGEFGMSGDTCKVL